MYDPFVGTGSMLYVRRLCSLYETIAAHYTEIDIRTVRGVCLWVRHRW